MTIITVTISVIVYVHIDDDINTDIDTDITSDIIATIIIIIIQQNVMSHLTLGCILTALSFVFNQCKFSDAMCNTHTYSAHKFVLLNHQKIKI